MSYAEINYKGKRLGVINKKVVYTTHRDFYKHKYHYDDAYCFEIGLINLLEKSKVDFIMIVEHHLNKQSNINETTKFLFPIGLFNHKDIKKIHHPHKDINKNFEEQKGIPMKLLSKYQFGETIKEI